MSSEIKKNEKIDEYINALIQKGIKIVVINLDKTQKSDPSFECVCMMVKKIENNFSDRLKIVFVSVERYSTKPYESNFLKTTFGLENSYDIIHCLKMGDDVRAVVKTYLGLPENECEVFNKYMVVPKNGKYVTYMEEPKTSLTLILLILTERHNTIISKIMLVNGTDENYCPYNSVNCTSISTPLTDGLFQINSSFSTRLIYNFTNRSWYSSTLRIISVCNCIVIDENTGNQKKFAKCLQKKLRPCDIIFVPKKGGKRTIKLL